MARSAPGLTLERNPTQRLLSFRCTLVLASSTRTSRHPFLAGIGYPQATSGGERIGDTNMSSGTPHANQALPPGEDNSELFLKELMTTEGPCNLRE